MKTEACKDAYSYWLRMDIESLHMDVDMLKKEISKYILSNNECIFSTVDRELVMRAPMEYVYYDNAFWIFPKNEPEFKALVDNKDVFIAIYDEYMGYNCFKGMQAEGKAEFVEPCLEDYDNIIKHSKRFEDLSGTNKETKGIIRIKPEEIEILNSDFKDIGYGIRQKIRYDL